jgi:hypothetical protein
VLWQKLEGYVPPEKGDRIMYQSMLLVDRSPILMEQGSLPHVAAARLRAAIAKDPTDLLLALGGTGLENKPFEEALNELGRAPHRLKGNEDNKFVVSLDLESNGHKVVVQTRRIEQRLYDHKKEIKLT